MLEILKTMMMEIHLKLLENFRKRMWIQFYSDVFNTANFGLPQDRRRVYMLAIKNGTNKNFEFTQDEVLKEFQNMKKENSLHKYKTTKSLLSKSR